MSGLDDYLDQPEISPDDITNLINAFTLISTWEDNIDENLDSEELFRTRELALIRKVLKTSMDNLSPSLIRKLTERIKELIGLSQ